MTKEISMERADFWKDFGLLVNGGYPISQVLDGASDSADAELKKVLPDIKNSFQSGEAFSDAMEKHGEAFSEFEIIMIRAGEAAGNLAKIAERLADIAANTPLTARDD